VGVPSYNRGTARMPEWGRTHRGQDTECGEQGAMAGWGWKNVGRSFYALMGKKKPRFFKLCLSKAKFLKLFLLKTVDGMLQIHNTLE
jgi:hypothetical protein